MIYFKDKEHEYISENNEKYTSVSSFIDNYKPKFDTEYWSTYKALEKILPNFKALKKKYSSEKVAVRSLALEIDSALLSDTINEFKTLWKNKSTSSSAKGTLYHKDREKMAYIRKVIENPFTKSPARVIKVEKLSKYDNQSLTKDLYQLEDGFYPELLLWNSKYRLAGQADKVYITTVKDIRYIDVDDYKTNNKIDLKGFKGEKMLDPLRHLENCNYINYSLKISTYAWMLEQFGFTVRHLGFHHYNTLYKVNYLKEEIESILHSLNFKNEIKNLVSS